MTARVLLDVLRRIGGVALLVISVPTLVHADAAWIAEIRRQHPGLMYSPLAPHFTFVFATAAVDENVLATHVQTQIAGWDPIPFVIRSCIPYKDPSSPYTYVLLVPDEG